MQDEKQYSDSIHRLGRIGSVIALAFMLGIPAVMCTVYNCWPKIGTVLQAGIGLLAMMIPSTISEVLSYVPILGSACYISFITGNVMNLKLPVAISAQQIAGVESNTPISDAVSTMAVALSSIETIIIIAIGVLLLKPLQPILTSPTVSTATSYMIPALFGGLFLGIFAQGGKTYIKNKPLIAAFPLVVVTILLFIFPSLKGYQGFVLLAMIPVTVIWAYALYKLGVVKMVSREPVAEGAADGAPEPAREVDRQDAESPQETPEEAAKDEAVSSDAPKEEAEAVLKEPTEARPDEEPQREARPTDDSGEKKDGE